MNNDFNRLLAYINMCTARFNEDDDTPIVFNAIPAVPTFIEKGVEHHGFGFWNAAEFVETLVDFYEQGIETERTKKLMRRFIEGMADNTCYKEGVWDADIGMLNNPFNDDLMWFCIALLRAYPILGDDFKPYKTTKDNKSLLEVAKVTFDGVCDRALTEEGGLSLLWKQGEDHKTCCSNFTTIIAACYLYKYYGEHYLHLAKLLMQWCEDNLIHGKKVYDKVLNYNHEKKTYIITDTKRWSYNYGTAVGAYLGLYNTTGEEACKDKAIMLARALVDSYKGNVPSDEMDGNDRPTFKGIAVRWLAKTGDINTQHHLNMWGRTARANENIDRLIWTAWGVKTPPNVAEMSYQGAPAAGILCMAALALLPASRANMERRASQ